MTINELEKLLKVHGIKTERFTDISIKAGNDIIEIIGSNMYLNGSLDFNIWEYLGY